jgi:hypothetical protein
MPPERRKAPSELGADQKIRFKVGVMDSTPIPQRIPALAWRAPSLLWTPLSLALAVGLPWGLCYLDPSLRRFELLTIIAAFVLTLTWFALSWVRGRPPKARRFVVEAVVWAAGASAVLAPLAIASSLSLDLATAWPLAALMLMLGLPAALASGVVFAWLALHAPTDEHPPSSVLGDSAFQSHRQSFR